LNGRDKSQHSKRGNETMIEALNMKSRRASSPPGSHHRQRAATTVAEIDALGAGLGHDSSSQFGAMDIAAAVLKLQESRATTASDGSAAVDVSPRRLQCLAGDASFSDRRQPLRSRSR
jgi:hypothetical protein